MSAIRFSFSLSASVINSLFIGVSLNDVLSIKLTIPSISFKYLFCLDPFIVIVFSVLSVFVMVICDVLFAIIKK